MGVRPFSPFLLTPPLFRLILNYANNLPLRKLLVCLTQRKNKTDMTPLQNQINKLSQVELKYFNLLNNKGITGEQALSHVLIASATGLLGGKK